MFFLTNHPGTSHKVPPYRIPLMYAAYYQNEIFSCLESLEHTHIGTYVCRMAVVYKIEIVQRESIWNIF